MTNANLVGIPLYDINWEHVNLTDARYSFIDLIEPPGIIKDRWNPPLENKEELSRGDFMYNWRSSKSPSFFQRTLEIDWENPRDR
jgi:hypothetical protein